MIGFDIALKASAEGWLKARTPFTPRGHSRRYGVDCVQLAHALYTEAGVELPPIPRDYFIDESRHNRTQKLIDWIESSGKFKEIEIGGEYRPGTLLCAEVGLAPYHVAVVYAHGQAIHSVRHAGVCSISTASNLFDKIIKAYEVI